MTELKSLFGDKHAIKIYVSSEDYQEFLEYAKTQGCLWSTGEVIKPHLAKAAKPLDYKGVFKVEKDLSNCHLYYISHLNGWAGFSCMAHALSYDFKDIKEGLSRKEMEEKSARLERKDEEFELSRQAKQAALKKRCSENYLINEIQLRNRNAAARLPKVFFVRYDNEDDLVKLFLLFMRCGYENVFCLDADEFPRNPQLITIDNQNMTFAPANLTDLSCCFFARKKLYSTSAMEELMTNVFGDENPIIL